MKINDEFYLDELTFSSFIYLFRKSNKFDIYILEKISSTKSKFLFWLLTKLNYKLSIIDFFAGHLKTSNGETVTIASVREASYASVNFIKNSNYSELLFKFLPPDYDTKVVDVFLSKLIYDDFYYIFLRSMIVESLSDTKNPLLIIKKLKKINLSNLKLKSKLVNIDFYYSINFFSFTLFKSYTYYFIAQTIKTLSNQLSFKKHTNFNTDLPGLLSFQSNTLREDLSLRGEPNWVDRNNTSPSHNTFILSKTTSFYKSGFSIPMSKDFSKLQVNNVFSIPIYEVSQIPSIKHLLSFFITGFKHRKNITENVKYYLLELLFLYYDTISFEKFLKKYNIKLVYFSESETSEPICLISQKLKIKTLAQQYSNLPFFSVLMTGKVDKFLLSSIIFEKCFKHEGVGPVSFESTGYSYAYAHKYISERSKSHRSVFEDNGVDFVICYFDERVDLNNKWGTVDNDGHLNDLIKLLDFILKNKNIGLVVKSQFMKYSPSNWYPNENIFKKALGTNRYLELNEGNTINRNDILPTEAALIADICISQKFGATAALESAVLQKRTVLINKYPIKTYFDDLYSKSQIVFNSMQEIIYAINEFTLDNKDYLNLGDWSPIIKEFNEFQDLDNQKRVRETIEKMI
jgi:hypothetical protein